MIAHIVEQREKEKQNLCNLTLIVAVVKRQDKQPVRVVVELVSAADVTRLEARDEDLWNELKQLRKENEALRRSFYELLEVFGEFKRSRSPAKK